MHNEWKHVKGREINLPCGEKCTMRCTFKFTVEDTTVLFNENWNIVDIVEYRAFIAIKMQESIRKVQVLHPKKVNSTEVITTFSILKRKKEDKSS